MERARGIVEQWLTALDNLGVSHGEGAQTLHMSISAATLGTNLEPALELFADMVLRPRFDEEEIEPIRALCLQNLRSLEDDPGTKVVYELRRRHFPEPWGRPAPGSADGVSGMTAAALRKFYRRNLSAQRRHPRRCRCDRLAPAQGRDRPAVRRLEDAAGPSAAREAHRTPARPHHSRDPADPDCPGPAGGHG